MAKLKPIDFRFNAKAGAPLTFRSEVSVADSSGHFSLTIPDELEVCAREVLRKRGSCPVFIDRPRSNLRVTGPSLQECRSFIEQVSESYIRCEVTEELVIAYGAQSKVAYVKDEYGNLYENGRACHELYDSRRASWQGTLNGTNFDKYYQVGLVARVFKKVTYSRSTGKTVEYHTADGRAFDGMPWLEKLNGFCGIGLIGRDKKLMASLQEMPYTEEAAQFFYNSLMAMCALADRIETFFSDKPMLTAAIEKQAGVIPALAAPSSPL